MARAQELTGRREAFVRATVVRAQHPTSAHAGDTALVLANGDIDGFLGGSCVEASVREYGLAALSRQEPLLLRVVPGEPSRTLQEGAVEVANPCLSGGAVEIFLEPQLPAPRVVVLGMTPVAQALAALGAVLDFDVELATGTAVVPRAGDAALIVASHGRDEEPALEAALRAGVPYIALVASRTRGAAVLASLDADDAARARVHSPAGLALGGHTPAEIALSILAELVAVRAAGRAAVPAGPGSADTGPAPADIGPASAVDPVCGMSVAAVAATLHTDYAGTVYYFCSPGCRAAFLADPQRYAGAS
ncbi:XdhC family protein [Pseudarthrobacter sp. P1]|uniref:XdhC family protein n=1 Tax=Pseudarthrobacter sp. P1 TaxID=3418418 RepID=UPI003CF62D54